MNFLMSLSMLPLQMDIRDLQMRNSNNFDSSTGYIFLFIIVVVVLLLVILNVVKSKYKPKPSEKHLAASGPRNFSSFTLHRLTGDLGLNRDQVRMLEYVLRSGGIQDPVQFLHSPAMIDRHFKRTYRLIERTSADDNELNNRLSMLFATRNIIEAKAGTAAVAAATTTTQQIPERISAMLTVNNTDYPVQIISSRGDTLVVENPKTNAGTLIHFSDGSKARLSFFTKASKGFSVETRILGTEETPRGQVLQMAHSGQIKKLASRHFRRHQTIISTVFFLVFEANKKLSVDKRRHAGTIVDISAGGCSIKTNIPVNTKQKLKIEFTHDDNSVVAALGEVLRTEKSGMSTILHIKFLKVPRKSLNSINSIVYEYGE